MHRKELWAILIVVAGVALVLVYAASHAVGQIIALNGSSSTAVPADESGWQTYTNSDYGFSVSYPPNWQLSTAGFGAFTPYVAIGNPLNGTSTYALDIVIENNSSSLSSGEYVHAMLAADKAQYQKSFVLNVNGVEAYELYDVFEFDHDAEQIYVAHGDIILRFDFPVAEENPNIALPVKNNAIAHEIMNTLTFSN